MRPSLLPSPRRLPPALFLPPLALGATPFPPASPRRLPPASVLSAGCARHGAAAPHGIPTVTASAVLASCCARRRAPPRRRRGGCRRRFCCYPLYVARFSSGSAILAAAAGVLLPLFARGSRRSSHASAFPRLYSPRRPCSPSQPRRFPTGVRLPCSLRVLSTERGTEWPRCDCSLHFNCCLRPVAGRPPFLFGAAEK